MVSGGMSMELGINQQPSQESVSGSSGGSSLNFLSPNWCCD